MPYLSISKPFLKIFLGILVFCFALNVEAQNTKGDKPTASPAPAKEKKKLFGKKKANGSRLGSSRGSRVRNVFPQKGQFVNNPSSGPRREKANTYRAPGSPKIITTPAQKDRAWSQSNASGQRIKPRSASGKITRVYPQQGSFINNPSSGPKKERPSTVRLPSSIKGSRTPSGKDRAWTQGTATGQRTIPRSKSGKLKSQNVFSQSGGFIHNSSNSSKLSKGNIYPQSGKFVNRSRTSSKARSRNIFPQQGPYVNNSAPVAKVAGLNPKNKPLSKNRRLSVSEKAAQARSMGIKNAGFATITSQFITRGRKNVYWGKIRKSGAAITTDIAGRKLRRKNYQSPKLSIAGRDTLPFFRRSPKGGSRTSAQLRTIRSATGQSKFSSGDISGSKLRRGKASGNKETVGHFFWPRNFSISTSGKVGRSRKGIAASATKTGKASVNRVAPKQPGIGGNALLSFSKRSSPLKKVKGFGGSVSGKSRNNNKPLAPRRGGTGTLAAGTFQGRSKTGKPFKGGGSVSGQLLNNRNQPLARRPASLSTLSAGNFQGKAKTGKPFKGGGSVSGQLWNNRNQPLARRPASSSILSAGNFQGKAKTGKPLKGGGSVSGQSLNNRNRPIAVRPGGLGTLAAGTFQGRAKTGRPLKGGGSISGQSLNNRNRPIEVRRGGLGTLAAGTFQGKAKTGKPVKGGGSISGQLWNNKNKPLAERTGGQGTLVAGTFQGKTKQQKTKHTAGAPAKYTGNIKGAFAGGDFSQLGLNYEGDSKRKKNGIDNKQRSLMSKLFKKGNGGVLPAKHISKDEQVANETKKGKKYLFSRYVQNPKAADASLKKDRLPNGIKLNVPILNQTKRSVNAGHYVHSVKEYWNYKRNPNSSKQALKLREPNKVNARLGDIQSNVKMKKYTNAQLHPDAQFAHSFRDNVKGERTLIMNFKLLWSKLFKKSDNQPRGLKVKPGRPRFDPKEQGMWYD